MPFCTNCGHANQANARFCGQCGTVIKTPVPESVSQAPPQPPIQPPTPPVRGRGQADDQPWPIDDIEVMRSVSDAHAKAVREQFDSWRGGWGFDLFQMIAWSASIAVSIYCLVADSPFPVLQLPLVVFRVVGAILGLGALMFASNAVEFMAQDQCWDAYFTGYSEGLRQGVSRAMNISPEEDARISETLSDQDLYDPEGAAQRANREWTQR